VSAAKKAPAKKAAAKKAPAKKAAAKKAPANNAPARKAAATKAPAKKAAATKAPATKAAATKAPAGGAPSGPSFWDRWAAGYHAMRADPRIEVVTPVRLAHAAVGARMLRMALQDLAQNGGAPTDVFAPFAGDFFYTYLCWRGPKDETGAHPFGGEVRLQGVGALLRPFDPTPGWALFDDHPNAGDGISTVIRPHEGRWQLGVFEYEVTPLALGVPGYMQALLDLRGAFGWQWLFVDGIRADRRKKLSLLLDRAEEYLGADTAAYRARLG
jgi:hypothetical protein